MTARKDGQQIPNKAAYYRPLKFEILTSGGSEMGYDWSDVIEDACSDAGISATKEQIDTIAAWAEGHHDNYSMSHGYDCIGDVSESMEVASLKSKIKELENELSQQRSSQREFLDRTYGKDRASHIDQYGYVVAAQ